MDTLGDRTLKCIWFPFQNFTFSGSWKLIPQFLFVLGLSVKNILTILLFSESFFSLNSLSTCNLHPFSLIVWSFNFPSPFPSSDRYLTFHPFPVPLIQLYSSPSFPHLFTEILMEIEKIAERGRKKGKEREKKRKESGRIEQRDNVMTTLIIIIIHPHPFPCYQIIRSIDFLPFHSYIFTFFVISFSPLSPSVFLSFSSSYHLFLTRLIFRYLIR